MEPVRASDLIREVRYIVKDQIPAGYEDYEPHLRESVTHWTDRDILTQINRAYSDLLHESESADIHEASWTVAVGTTDYRMPWNYHSYISFSYEDSDENQYELEVHHQQQIPDTTDPFIEIFGRVIRIHNIDEEITLLMKYRGGIIGMEQYDSEVPLSPDYHAYLTNKAAMNLLSGRRTEDVDIDAIRLAMLDCLHKWKDKGEGGRTTLQIIPAPVWKGWSANQRNRKGRL